MIYPDIYQCSIERVSLKDDELQTIVFSGDHLDGFVNSDVTHFRMRNCEIPFVITQVFFTFINLKSYSAVNSGLSRIQPGAIRNAPKLNEFHTFFHPNLTTITPAVFAGASSLRELTLDGGSITELHPNAFIGLRNLRVLTLSHNQIRKLPEGVFRHLPRLTSLILTSNLIEVLDTKPFPFNSRIEDLFYNSNRLNAIDKSVLEQHPLLNRLFLSGNI
jgi:Leucine-rich repeat (LRR) protein